MLRPHILDAICMQNQSLDSSSKIKCIEHDWIYQWLISAATGDGPAQWFMEYGPEWLSSRGSASWDGGEKGSYYWSHRIPQIRPQRVSLCNFVVLRLPTLCMRFNPFTSIWSCSPWHMPRRGETAKNGLNLILYKACMTYDILLGVRWEGIYGIMLVCGRL